MSYLFIDLYKNVLVSGMSKYQSYLSGRKLRQTDTVYTTVVIRAKVAFLNKIPNLSTLWRIIAVGSKKADWVRPILGTLTPDNGGRRLFIQVVIKINEWLLGKVNIIVRIETIPSNLFILIPINLLIATVWPQRNFA